MSSVKEITEQAMIAVCSERAMNKDAFAKAYTFAAFALGNSALELLEQAFSPTWKTELYTWEEIIDEQADWAEGGGEVTLDDIKGQVQAYMEAWDTLRLYAEADQTLVS